MKDDVQIFCENVRWIKEKEGLSDRQLASILQIGLYSTRKLLKGELPGRMSVDVVFHIARHLGCRPSEVFVPMRGGRHT